MTPDDVVRTLQQGDRDAALRALRFALEYPRDPGPIGPWCEALAVVARAFRDEALGTRADAVAIDPADAQALFDLGWGLVEARLYGQAATFLACALAARPHEPAIVLELVSALEHAGANAAAREVLAAEPEVRAASFTARYLLAFNAVMAGDLPGARAAAKDLAPAAPEDTVPAERIRDMLARATAVADVTPLDADDLRGWHYVLTGGLLLHTASHGRDEMHGRYAFVQDTDARCFEDILRLRRLLGFLRVEPKVLFSLPDRDSAIFATAAAKVLRLPLQPWAEGTRERGVIVAYDLGAAEPDVRTALLQRRRGQVLWSHTLSWTEPVGVAPEFVGVLHQVNTPPWGPRLVRNPDTGAVERRPARGGSVDELAARILASGVEDLPEQAALDALAQTGDISAAAWRKSTGKRDPLWFMGPVKSGRFY